MEFNKFENLYLYGLRCVALKEQKFDCSAVALTRTSRPTNAPFGALFTITNESLFYFYIALAYDYLLTTLQVYKLLVLWTLVFHFSFISKLVEYIIWYYFSFDWLVATIFLRLFSLHYTTLHQSNLLYLIITRGDVAEGKYIAQEMRPTNTTHWYGYQLRLRLRMTKWKRKSLCSSDCLVIYVMRYFYLKIDIFRLVSWENNTMNLPFVIAS